MLILQVSARCSSRSALSTILPLPPQTPQPKASAPPTDAPLLHPVTLTGQLTTKMWWGLASGGQTCLVEDGGVQEWAEDQHQAPLGCPLREALYLQHQHSHGASQYCLFQPGYTSGGGGGTDLIILFSVGCKCQAPIQGSGHPSGLWVMITGCCVRTPYLWISMTKIKHVMKAVTVWCVARCWVSESIEALDIVSQWETCTCIII